MNIWNDKVIRAMLAFALGIVMIVLQVASSETNKFLLVLAILWSTISLFFVFKEVKEDWAQ